MYKHALTIGTFDLVHAGHAYLFQRCEQVADNVTVGINSDEFVAEYKGARPLMSYEERAELINALGYSVVKNESAGRECIEQVKPDVLVIGSDWARRDYYKQIDVDQDFMDERNISMLYIPRITNLSTTLIKQLIGRPTPLPIPDNAEAERLWARHHNGI